MPRKLKDPKKDLVKKVREYLWRARSGRDIGVKLYPLDERGMYRIVGGAYLNGRREEIIEIFKGRYIDVVAEAVQLSAFYGDWCGSDQPGNCNNGYVRKYEPDMIIEVPEQKGLIGWIKAMDDLENEKTDLEGKLAKVNEQMEGMKNESITNC